MRPVDWLLMAFLFFGIIAGKYNLNPNPTSPRDNPRRPNPQFFEKNSNPKLWERETQKWLSLMPHKKSYKKKTGIYLSSKLPKEGTITSFKKQEPSVGSAFSISKNGTWLTAAHVVNGCNRVSIKMGADNFLPVVSISSHPKADLALLRTKLGSNEIKIETTKTHNDSFSIGFPRAFPGVLHSKFLGSMAIRHKVIGQKHLGFRETVNVWTEVSRISKYPGSVGGLSGGAVVNSNGNVIGVVQAENFRRGRILTAQIYTIKELLDLALVTLSQHSKTVKKIELNSENYHLTARKLILSKSIARVHCSVR